MSIYEKTKVARALLYWAKNNNGNECYYLEDRMYAVADGDKVIILTADSYDEAKRKAKGDYAITIDIQPEDAEAFKKAIENARVCRVEDSIDWGTDGGDRTVYARPQGDLADEVWKLYEKHHSHLATHVIEFGDELKDLLSKYQKGGAE